MRPPPDNEQIVKLAKLIYEIEELAAPSIDTVNSWRARVASLTTSKAFQYNPIIQSRAFLLLGCMARGEIDDDLLYQILVSLRGAVHEWANKGNPATVISIVICLSKVVKILPTHSRYIAQLFWLGTAVVQFGSVALFSAGIELIFASIQTIQERHLPEAMGTDLINFLMDSRSGAEEAACQMEDETGLNFDVNFSFSLAALVVKGLRHPSTKDKTNALLRCVLEASSIGPDGSSQSPSRRVSAEQLGIYLALLPSVTRPEALGEILALAGLPQDYCDEAVQARKRGSVKDGNLMKYFDPLDNRTALLSFALVAALLRTADDDAERLVLFTFLAESGPWYPAILSIVYDQLTPSLHVALANAQSARVLEAVQTIASTAIFEPVFAAQVAETANRGGPGAFLEEAGFPMLLDCASFDPNAMTKERRLIMATLATGLLGSFIEGSSSFQ
jgi:neurofibromin 1